MTHASMDLRIRYDHCPICKAELKSWGSKVGDGVNYRIDRCTGCGYAFVNPRPDQAWLANWYEKSGHQTSELKLTDHATLESVLEREEKSPNSTLDAKRMIDTLRGLSNTKGQLRFLDVGCGYGFFSREAIKQGFNVTALELASNERGIAGELLGVEPIASSFEDFSHPKKSFDAVLMSQILEHAGDVNVWIEKVHALLDDDGLVAIAVPNFNGFLRYILRENEPYITPPAHLNYFSPVSLSKLLEKHGFKVEVIQHVSRISRGVFEKRLPKGLPGLVNMAYGVSKILLGVADKTHIGMIFNVYARKL